MSITDISLALANLNEKRKEHDDAFANSSGYSWGYHGAEYIYALSKAERDLKEALDSHIDERVRAILKEKT